MDSTSSWSRTDTEHAASLLPAKTGEGGAGPGDPGDPGDPGQAGTVPHPPAPSPCGGCPQEGLSLLPLRQPPPSPPTRCFPGSQNGSSRLASGLQPLPLSSGVFRLPAHMHVSLLNEPVGLARRPSYVRCTQEGVGGSVQCGTQGPRGTGDAPSAHLRGKQTDTHLTHTRENDFQSHPRPGKHSHAREALTVTHRRAHPAALRRVRAPTPAPRRVPALRPSPAPVELTKGV